MTMTQLYAPFFTFFFTDTATTEIYTLSLHDALPISRVQLAADPSERSVSARTGCGLQHHRMHAGRELRGDRKSTRLNSSHVSISYAVFCLKKKKKKYKIKIERT